MARQEQPEPQAHLARQVQQEARASRVLVALDRQAQQAPQAPQVKVARQA